MRRSIRSGAAVAVCSRSERRSRRAPAENSVTHRTRIAEQFILIGHDVLVGRSVCLLQASRPADVQIATGLHDVEPEHPAPNPKWPPRLAQ
jgi:hypothetical protein